LCLKFFWFVLHTMRHSFDNLFYRLHLDEMQQVGDLCVL